MEEPQSGVFVGTCVFNLVPQRFFLKGTGVYALHSYEGSDDVYIVWGFAQNTVSMSD